MKASRRTWIFVLVGAVVVATLGSVLGLMMGRMEVCGLDGRDYACSEPWLNVLGISIYRPMAVVWPVVIGAFLGGSLGLLPARVTRPPAAGFPIVVWGSVVLTSLFLVVTSSCVLTSLWASEHLFGPCVPSTARIYGLLFIPVASLGFLADLTRSRLRRVR